MILVVINGMILSHSGLLSYTRFSWQAFAQSYPLGQACASPTECRSGFCVDGVCCNQACTAAGEMCTGGVCHGPAPVPALDGPGEVLAVLVLIGGALLGWRLRRTD